VRCIAAHDAAARISLVSRTKICFAIHEQFHARKVTQCRREVQWSALETRGRVRPMIDITRGKREQSPGVLRFKIGTEFHKQMAGSSMTMRA